VLTNDKLTHINLDSETPTVSLGSHSFYAPVNPVLERIKNQSNVRLFFTLPWTLRDCELFNMSSDVNTYVYLVFLRMSLRFFLVLALVNCLILIPLYTTGTAQKELYKTILPQI
jgi:hypothetical protein